MNYRQRLDEYRSRLIELAKQGAAAFHRARTQQVDIATAKAKIAGTLNHLRQLAKREQKLTLSELRPWLQQYGLRWTLILIAPVATLAFLFLVNEQINRLSNTLSLRPTQLMVIESLILDSKRADNSSVAALSLTDNDLETMRVILQNRGITPNILRLNVDHGVSIEIQVDQAVFGQWISFLEEIAQRWQVYPTQLTLKSSDQPETVSVRGTLQQSPISAP